MPANKYLIDLNNSERKLLTQLPGVTKDISYRIVNYRKRHGGQGLAGSRRRYGFVKRQNGCSQNPRRNRVEAGSPLTTNGE